MEMEEDLVAAMLEKGYIEQVGYNAVGDPLYRLTPLFYKEQKELVEWMRKEDSDILSSLWFKGYIDLKMSDDGLGYLYLTDKSDYWVNAEDLSDDEKSMMYLIFSTGAYFGGHWDGYQERN